MGNHIPLCTGRRNCFCHQRADELSGKDDLWEGQSDEGDLGYDYTSLDEILRAILHKKSLAKFDQETINFIQNRIKNNKFKLKMPKILHLKG